MTACPARPLPDSPYGAPELKGLARAYLTRAIVSGSGLWLVLFVLAVAASSVFFPPIRHVGVPAPPYPHVLEPPNGVLEPSRPDYKISRPPASKPDANPVPVPRPPDAPPEVVDPGKDLPLAPGGATPGPNPTDLPGNAPPADGPMPSPNDVVLVDEYPVVITIVKPDYPSLAHDAGVEGLVIVRALVDREGHVREAFIDSKHSIPMLDEAALAAARRWVFKPAFTANHPVAVWVAIPMRFTLH